MFSLAFLSALTLGTIFFSSPLWADRDSLLKDPELPAECLDRKLVGADEKNTEAQVEEKLLEFFKARRENTACQKELLPTLRDYQKKRDALLKAINENLDGGERGDPNSRRPKDQAAYSRIKKAEKEFLAVKFRLFYPTALRPVALFDRCGFCATRQLHREKIKGKDGSPLVRYTADGSCLIPDGLDPFGGGDVSTASERYERVWQDLTNLAHYPRNPVTLAGYDHVFAFARVTEKGEFAAKPEEDEKEILKANDLKEHPDAFAFIAAGANFGLPLIYYYYVESHLYPKIQHEDSEEFWIKFSTTDKPEFKNLGPAVTQYRLSAADPPKAVRPQLLKNSKGEWCERKKVSTETDPSHPSKPSYFYNRYFTLGDFEMNSEAGEKVARITLLGTLFQNVQKTGALFGRRLK